MHASNHRPNQRREAWTALYDPQIARQVAIVSQLIFVSQLEFWLFPRFQPQLAQFLLMQESQALSSLENKSTHVTMKLKLRYIHSHKLVTPARYLQSRIIAPVQ